ncbi:MAG: twitching motility protein PilT, partial [Planctomycetota bacterium]
MPETELKDLEKLFIALAKNKGSDLHLKVGLKPIFRVAGVLHEAGPRVLTADGLKKLVYEILTEKQREKFASASGGHDLDFAYSLEGTGRFRVNVFQERGQVALAVRRVNT